MSSPPEVQVADEKGVVSQEIASSDHGAPSPLVSASRQRLSDLFTIFCAGFALISDGYQNNLM